MKPLLTFNIPQERMYKTRSARCLLTSFYLFINFWMLGGPRHAFYDSSAKIKSAAAKKKKSPGRITNGRVV